MSEEQASDRDDFDSARSLQLSPAVSEQSSLPTPNRQSNNKRQLRNSPPPLSSASSHVSSTKSNASESSTSAKKHHPEPTSTYSSVANKIETLVRDLKTQCEKVPEGHWEKIRYEAAEFCLTAIRLAPTESGKEYVARSVGGNDVTPASCRNFAGEVQTMLLGTVQVRSCTWQLLRAVQGHEILKRNDYRCLITGQRDDYALGVLAGEPEIDDQAGWLFQPFPLAPWFFEQEYRQSGSPGLTYEIKLNKHSIPQIPLKLPASRILTMNVSLCNPDQVTLLSLHSFFALLLRESAIGKTWVTDPDWNSIDDIDQGTDPSIPDDEKDPEELPSEEELNARREASKRKNEEAKREWARWDALEQKDPDREVWQEPEEVESFADFYKTFKKEATEAGAWGNYWQAFDKRLEEDKARSDQ